jgi:hypothetical protein
MTEGAGNPGFADAGRANEILPKISSSTFRSTTRIILAPVSMSRLCDPFSTAAIDISP